MPNPKDKPQFGGDNPHPVPNPMPGTTQPASHPGGRGGYSQNPTSAPPTDQTAAKTPLNQVPDQPPHKAP